MGLIALIVIFLKEEEEGARGNEMESQGAADKRRPLSI